MKTAWAITVYLGSTLPLNTNSVVSVISIDCVFIGDEPSKEDIEAFIHVHTQNCELLIAEVTKTSIPRDFSQG